MEKYYENFASRTVSIYDFVIYENTKHTIILFTNQMMIKNMKILVLLDAVHVIDDRIMNFLSNFISKNTKETSCHCIFSSAIAAFAFDENDQ